MRAGPCGRTRGEGGFLKGFVPHTANVKAGLRGLRGGPRLSRAWLWRISRMAALPSTVAVSPVDGRGCASIVEDSR